MPAEQTLDHADRLVRTRAWDIVTAGDLFELSTQVRQLFTDGTIDAGWRELVDFREVTRTDFIPTEAVRRLATENPWPVSARRVIIAPVSVVFGVSRMYQLLSTADESIRVVRTEAEAHEFLRTDPSAPA